MFPPLPGDAVLEQMREDKETAESQVCSHVLISPAVEQECLWFLLFFIHLFTVRMFPDRITGSIVLLKGRGVGGQLGNRLTQCCQMAESAVLLLLQYNVLQRCISINSRVKVYFFWSCEIDLDSYLWHWHKWNHLTSVQFKMLYCTAVFFNLFKPRHIFHRKTKYQVSPPTKATI